MDINKFSLDDIFALSDMIAKLTSGKNVLLYGVQDVFGKWDRLTIGIVCRAEFNKLKVTEYPIPESLEDWYCLFTGVVTEIDDLFGVTNILNYIDDNTKPFEICGDMPVHIRMIMDADFIFGMPNEKIVEPYIKLLKQFKKEFAICVDSIKADKLIKKYSLKKYGTYTTTNKTQIVFIGTGV